MTDPAPVSLFRHPAWIAWKESQGWKRAETGLGCSALCRRIGTAGSMAYIPGPLSLPGLRARDIDERGAAMEALSLRALPKLPPDCVFIRWDLMVEAWTDGRGSALNRGLQELRMNASTVRRRFRKAPVEYTCPDTMILDLTGGPAAVWSRMEAKTRYAVRLAERRGTVVERTGEAGLRTFHELYGRTASRKGLPRHPESLFRKFFREARDRGLELDLYLARYKDEPAAAAVVARVRDEAWYLFAASSWNLRSAAGPSAVLHRAAADCARAGVRRMDLLGVSPPDSPDHPLAGLTRFKKGFGGRRHTRAGAWDYVVDGEIYSGYARTEGLSRP
ncbi:MAG TPA: peptidoglycan bridge formation glycyltransferase FemA/FemB family protein [Spirochaetia bacterium]|nr:peptidoglycan bridge formation glycyltransferase FemA/FemB family protein [Spirochaetales bacterium]HRY79024.1 peptidoglycan bridge formation glycyltransferase FemA/FemB family protein [Spirochaetia bacterium]HRZ89764.1 peptidoglycan bridge formation glycyltransferase FemA/FemB family protein [Spirochaetia bacterium]